MDALSELDSSSGWVKLKGGKNMVSFAEFWDKEEKGTLSLEEKSIVHRIRLRQRVWVEEQIKELQLEWKELEKREQVFISELDGDFNPLGKVVAKMNIVKGKIEFCEEMLEGLR
jgi:hypothetical protein